MRTLAFGEQHKVIKRMPVRLVQIGIMFLQVSSQPLYEQVLVNTPVNGADII
jgi:hypothetical protein